MEKRKFEISLNPKQALKLIGSLSTILITSAIAFINVQYTELTHLKEMLAEQNKVIEELSENAGELKKQYQTKNKQ